MSGMYSNPELSGFETQAPINITVARPNVSLTIAVIFFFICFYLFCQTTQTFQIEVTWQIFIFLFDLIQQFPFPSTLHLIPRLRILNFLKF